MPRAQTQGLLPHFRAQGPYAAQLEVLSSDWESATASTRLSQSSVSPARDRDHRLFNGQPLKPGLVVLALAGVLSCGLEQRLVTSLQPVSVLL